MKGRGKIKGILIEGDDGHEYLLGFGPAERPRSPIFSRRRADGTFEALANTAETSRFVTKQIGHTGGLIGPGMGKDVWLWGAFRAALEAFPPIPTWPTWSS